MENTLFSCSTHDPGQLVWMQLPLTHFGSENPGTNSSMATMERGEEVSSGPYPFSRAEAALLLMFSPIPHLFCRISFHAGSLAPSRNLLHCFPTTSTKKVFPTVWISYFATDASAQMFPAPSGAMSLHHKKLRPEVSSLGQPHLLLTFLQRNNMKLSL